MVERCEKVKFRVNIQYKLINYERGFEKNISLKTLIVSIIYWSAKNSKYKSAEKIYLNENKNE